MSNYYRLNLLASTYGSGAYNSSTYNGQAQTSTGSGTGTSTGTGTGGGGSLSNTGVAIVGIVTLAALILLVAMVVRIWRRPAKAVEVVEDNNSGDELADK